MDSKGIEDQVTEVFSQVNKALVGVESLLGTIKGTMKADMNKEEAEQVAKQLESLDPNGKVNELKDKFERVKNMHNASFSKRP